MIYLTDADKEKLNLLDDIFRTVPVDAIRKLSEADRIVEVLKEGNTSKPNGVIVQVFEEHNRMSMHLAQMQTDIMILRNQLSSIVRIMGRPQYDNQNVQEINSLKSQLGAY